MPTGGLPRNLQTSSLLTAFGVCVLHLLSGSLGADDAIVTPAAAVAADNIQRIFAGTAPGNLADLKAMQAHVYQMSDKLTKCTVGVEVGPAQGSGVIISKDGYVLTAAHVANPPRRGPGGRNPAEQEVTFYLSDGRKVTGKTLGLYRTLDAGLLKITDPGEYPYAEMGDSEALKLGQWCLVMGHPGGYQNDRGAVMRMGRVIWLDKGAITTDCTLVGGDSGGPLFDMQGRVIGINSRIAEEIVQNMHVPVAAYKDSWDRLVSGQVWGNFPGRTAYLGVQSEDGAKEAKISSVVPDSPAAEAGIKTGDIVVKFGSKAITDFDSLKAAVADHEPRRQPVTLKIRRGTETIELPVKLRIRDSD